jgi:hypothetical protein
MDMLNDTPVLGAYVLSLIYKKVKFSLSAL